MANSSTSRAEAMQIAQALKYMRRQALEKQALLAQAQAPKANPMDAVAGLAKKEALKYVAKEGGKAMGLTSAAPTAGTIPGGVASMPGGGTLMADGTVVGSAPSSTGALSMGNVAGAVAALKGGYDTINGLQHGGEGLRSGLTMGGAGIGQMVAGPLGAGAGAVLGNIAGYGLQGDGWKNKLALTAVLPPLGIAKMLGFNPIHKTTRQVAQEHTADLQGQFKDDKMFQDYVAGMRAQHNAPPPDKSKPFAGKYATWDEYKKAGLEAGDLTGVYGNMKTFGQDWTKIDQRQREAVTKGLIDAGLYNSKKGEVEINDADRAKEIYKTTLANLPAVAAATTGQGTRGKQEVSTGKKKASGKFPLEALPPLTSPIPVVPEVDPRIADAYKRIFEENQGVTGNSPWQNNPWLKIGGRR